MFLFFLCKLSTVAYFKTQMDSSTVNPDANASVCTSPEADFKTQVDSSIVCPGANASIYTSPATDFKTLMDSSIVCPDANASMYTSPEASLKTVETGRIKISVSVSSLAEKFEKGEDSEEKQFTEGGLPESEKELNLSETINLQDVSDSSEINDLVNKEKIVSVSVSNLTEKFEKGVDSVKSEEKEVAKVRLPECQKDMNLSETVNLQDISHSCEIKVLVNKEKLVTEDASQPCVTTESASNSLLKEENSDSTKSMKTNVSNTLLFSEVIDVVSSAIENVDSSCIVPQPSTSTADVNSDKTQISSAVEERVAYFAEKISQTLQNVVPSAGAEDNSESSASFAVEAGKVTVASEHDSKYFSEVASLISLRDLEQSFVIALNTANAVETKKDENMLRVPSIEITEASDQEEIDEEIVTETEVREAEVKMVNNVEQSDTKPTNDNVEDPIPSTSTGSQMGKKDESKVGEEERKAFFYISSSELPERPLNEPIEYSDELQQQEENSEESTESVRMQQSVKKKFSSCLCSKSIHGAVFLSSILVALFGFILYNMAHDGRVPDFCEPLGLITAITAGIIGAFSCFCFSFLEAFPQVPVTAYERIVNTGTIPPANDNRKFSLMNVDEESWSSETERAFRRQNGMSSTHTSEGSLRSRRELIEKTEKLKKEVVSLLDSFTDMIVKQRHVDELAEMESGAASNVKPSNGHVNATNEV